MNIGSLPRRIINKAKKVMFEISRECNVCGMHLNQKFSPLDPSWAENLKQFGYPHTLDDAETLNHKEYYCPHCGSSDRDRLYTLYLKKTLISSKNYHLLDIAPASALRAFIKTVPNIQYRSADLSMEGVDDHIDIMDMNIYPDASFDIFICSHVLEHVLDDKIAMKELHRILKPDGFGIAMVPIVLAMDQIDEDPTVTDIAERWRRFGQDDHVRLYSKKAYKTRLKECGFKVREYTVKDFSQKEFQLHGISKKSVLYIVSK